jgi:hypothetical protein
MKDFSSAYSPSGTLNFMANNKSFLRSAAAASEFAAGRRKSGREPAVTKQIT